MVLLPENDLRDQSNALFPIGVDVPELRHTGRYILGISSYREEKHLPKKLKDAANEGCLTVGLWTSS